MSKIKHSEKGLLTPDNCVVALIDHRNVPRRASQSVGRFPSRFAIEVCRNGYRYFYKHYGSKGARPAHHLGGQSHADARRPRWAQ